MLGQGGPDAIAKRFPDPFQQYVPNMLFRGDLQEICDFTLQAHLGMESIHDWWKKKGEKRRERAAKRQANQDSTMRQEPREGEAL